MEKIALDTDRDNFMGGDQAVAYGLIDRVMQTRVDPTAVVAPGVGK
jgi:ATP-dependent Clp protease protease subunit